MTTRSWLWTLWAIVCTIVAAGTLALQMASSATHIPIVFKENATLAIFEQTRLVDSPLMASVMLPSAKLDKGTPEQDHPHGTWSNVHKSSKPEEQFSTIFPFPGTPIELDISWDGVRHPYEALPASTVASDNPAERQLVPRVNDDNPLAFKWPLPKNALPALDAGTSRLVVTTGALHPKLIGQAATLVIDPRVSFKYTTPGYDIIWWFYFWPIYAVLLGISAWLLLRAPRRIVRVRSTTP